jgi:RNA polymerase sigma factor (sigma-70 family)
MATGEAAARALRLSPRAPLRLLGDERLAGLARRGDQRAFETIFRRYHQELYRFCRGILADPHEAQDALQSTMEAALRALPDEERRIALRPWLYRVAHNESISILRRRSAVVDPALPEAPEPAADSQAEPRERLRQLVADLDSLPDRQRVALVMRELSGLGYPEIAQALAASEAAARQVVYEARLALRDVAQGREMECDEVRRALSERDGRILRARRMRAHLRACEPCRDFRAGISRRSSDLEALCPPLPVGVASGLFAAVGGELGKAGIEAAGPTAAGALGAGGGAAGNGLGVATTSIGSSAVLKATSIAAAVTIGAGAAGIAGPVHVQLGNPATGPAPAGRTAALTAPASAPGPAEHRSAGARRAGGVAHGPAVGPARDASTGEHSPKPAGANAARGHGRQGAAAGTRGSGARHGVAKPPAGPSRGAGRNDSSNGAAAPGRARSAAAPSSHAPPGLEHAASHSHPSPASHSNPSPASHSHASASHSLPAQARGAPASHQRPPGPPPGHGHHG